MKKHILFILSILFYFSTIAQDEDPVKNLKFWEINYTNATELYCDILDLQDSSLNDSIIKLKTIGALNYLNISIKNCIDAKSVDPRYQQDAYFMIIESCLLGAWINQIKECKPYLSDSTARTFMRIALTIRPLENSISYYNLNYMAYNKEESSKLYYDQIFLALLHASEDNNSHKIQEYSNIYINYLKNTHGESLNNYFFNDDENYYQQNRIYKILNLAIPHVNISLRLEYNIMLMEYFAAFYESNNNNSIVFELLPVEIDMINKIQNFCNKNINDNNKKDVDYLHRISTALLRLNLLEDAYKYYPKSVTNYYSSTDQIWKFLETSKTYHDTCSNPRTKASLNKNISNAVTLLESRLGTNASEEELLRLLPFFKVTKNAEKIQEVNLRIGILERQRIEQGNKEEFKRLNSLSIGLAPLKLATYNRYNSFSVMGDLKINGFEQGFRFSYYNQFEDHWRFGSWAYSSNEDHAYNTYSGYEVSYWVTLIQKNHGNVKQKFCLELRKGTYKFNPIVSDIINRETNEFMFFDYDINPVGHRYDVSLVYRVIFYASDLFFVESNFSVGGGYRILNSEFNSDDFIIYDERFDSSKWPMVTVPLRVGIRAGIKIF